MIFVSDTNNFYNDIYYFISIISYLTCELGLFTVLNVFNYFIFKRISLGLHKLGQKEK